MTIIWAFFPIFLLFMVALRDSKFSEIRIPMAVIVSLLCMISIATGLVPITTGIPHLDLCLLQFQAIAAALVAMVLLWMYLAIKGLWDRLRHQRPNGKDRVENRSGRQRRNGKLLGFWNVLED